MIAGIPIAEPIIQTKALVIRLFFSYLSEIKPQEIEEINPQSAIIKA